MRGETALRDAGFQASSWQTGGGCGTVGVTLSPTRYAYVGPEHGPYAYGIDEGEDMGDVWGVWAYDDSADDEEQWHDAKGVAYGDATIPASDIVSALKALA
jgi:hypothetical protein